MNYQFKKNFPRKYGVSIQLLNQRLKTFFLSMDVTKFHSVTTLARPSRMEMTSATDLVFMGEAPLLLAAADLHYVYKRQYRIWVLNRRMKTVVAKYFKLHESQIGVVPRYALYPLPRETTPLSIPECRRVVYSGRWIPGKNLDMLFAWWSYFRKTVSSRKPEFIWIGPDSEPDSTPKKRISPPFAQHYRGDWGTSWYRKLDPKTDLIANFSTYFSDDFNVSLAQAQANGFSTVCTDWNGFSDMRGAGATLFPAQWLDQLREKKIIMETFHRRLLNREHRFRASEEAPETMKEPQRPTPTTGAELIGRAFSLSAENSVALGRFFSIDDPRGAFALRNLPIARILAGQKS